MRNFEVVYPVFKLIVSVLTIASTEDRNRQMLLKNCRKYDLEFREDTPREDAIVNTETISLNTG
jgi:hypothetical protein